MLESVRRAYAPLFVMAAVGCRSSEAAPQPAPAESAFCTGCAGDHDQYDEKDLIVPSRAKPGDLSRCPVSEAVFRVEPDSPRVEHGGKTGVVCCEGCKQRFVAQPERFAKQL